MSNNRIFTGSRVEYQGRNANLQGTMVRRSPTFTAQQAPERPETTPFANYHCKSGETLYSDSQISISEQNETLRAIAREETARTQAEQEQMKKAIQMMQAQISDFKEKLVEQQKMIKNKAEQPSPTQQQPQQPSFSKDDIRV